MQKSDIFLTLTSWQKRTSWSSFTWLLQGKKIWLRFIELVCCRHVTAASLQEVNDVIMVYCPLNQFPNDIILNQTIYDVTTSSYFRCFETFTLPNCSGVESLLFIKYLAPLSSQHFLLFVCITRQRKEGHEMVLEKKKLLVLMIFLLWKLAY